MRRALHRELPALTAFYGLRPWEVDQLEYGEVDVYLAFMEQQLSSVATPDLRKKHAHGA